MEEEMTKLLVESIGKCIFCIDNLNAQMHIVSNDTITTQMIKENLMEAEDILFKIEKHIEGK